LNVKPIYGSVTGVVKDSLTGKPIRGAYVEIKKLRNGDAGFRVFAAWNLNALTDGNGRYVFEQLVEGDYLLDVYANGGFAYYKNASVPGMADTLRVEGGRKFLADVSLILRNDGKGSISGKIKLDWGWEKTNLDSSSSASPVSSRPLSPLDASVQTAVVKAKPAVTVLSYPQSEWFYSAVTDSDGTYTLSGLPPGDYFVSSFASYRMLEYYKDAYDPANATLIHVEKEEAVTGIDMALSPMLFYWAMDSGLKMEGTTSLSGKVEDATGNALAGASVYVLDAEGNALTFAVTGADGVYEMGGIQPGNYFVQACKPGYQTQYNGTAAAMTQTAPVNVSAGTNTLNFRLTVGQVTGVDAPGGALPSDIALLGCYPNPFNPETRIAFALPERMRVTLRVFNPLGREVAVLCDGHLEPGRHELAWKGKDGNGNSMPSGLYFYRLETSLSAKTGKMMLIR
jgi:protocatechuate 3,4-dioxygenase beta subunit